MNNIDKDFDDITDRLSFTMEEKQKLYDIIEPILIHDKWMEMQKYKHHLDSRARHSIEVCCKAWLRASKMKKCDKKALAIGAILHDFFFYDWQHEKADLESLNLNKKIRRPKMHGFVHPLVSLDNAYKYFPEMVNKKVADIIAKHMWPLTIVAPKYKEAWLVCMTDKTCSLNIIKKPKELPYYLGLKKREQEMEEYN